jgi:5-methylthioadenosine/S-adenosylhomocysteine deaminase
MDLAAKLQKITKMDPRALGAKSVLEMATIEGTKALHGKRNRSLGWKESGYHFDRPRQTNAVPMFDVYAQLAYARRAATWKL